MNRGVHSRGYLPHWDFADSVQAITFRLADSVPAQVIRLWKRDLESVADDKLREKQLHQRIARYEDAGHGDAILAEAACATLVQDQFIKDHGTRYKLIAWVVMPNHVHLLIRLLDGASLCSLVQRWKGASAIEINRHRQRSGTLWAPDYYDRYIRDSDHLCDAITYIDRNPVKAGLCGRPQDWPFSSAGVGWSADFSPPETQEEPQAD
jgi:REP element-mobilizing transposase RayT